MFYFVAATPNKKVIQLLAANAPTKQLAAIMVRAKAEGKIKFITETK